MHASEMADGNRWQKEIAKLAIKKLSPVDEVGILYYDWGGMRWHLPLQEIGSKRGFMLGKVDNSACPAITVNIQLRLTLPADAKGPVPVIMEFGFFFGGKGPPVGGKGPPGWQQQLLALREVARILSQQQPLEDGLDHPVGIDGHRHGDA